MKITDFSDKYAIRALTREDIEEVYNLLNKNILYYEYCPPFVTRQSILEDMSALPPGKTLDDKYYIGFYQKNKLIAVMDLVDCYPEKEMAYIGFFMTDISVQNKGTGTEIIDNLCKYLTGQKYHCVRLAWADGNPQAEHFWLKNGFKQIIKTKSNVSDKVVLAERVLN